MSAAAIIEEDVARGEIRERIEELREELDKGRRRAAALDAEREELRDTLLRIGGAIQVLGELLDAGGDERDA